MTEVSLFRLYVLRALYLFIAVGLAVYHWPSVIDPATHWTMSQGYAACMLCAFSLLCVLGLRYPLQMLPMLMWELIWKALWCGMVPLPQWWAGGEIAPEMAASIVAVGMGVVLVPLAVPWRYVLVRYVMAPGDRWW
jgi:hypothetical protein